MMLVVLNIVLPNMKSNKKIGGTIIILCGLSDSDRVVKSVNAREPKIMAACLEIAPVITDLIVKEVGGMETALMLCKSCCIPSMVHGA